MWWPFRLRKTTGPYVSIVFYNLVDQIHFNHIIILMWSVLLPLLLLDKCTCVYGRARLYMLYIWWSFSFFLLSSSFLCLYSDFYPNGGRASQPGCGGIFKELLGKLFNRKWLTFHVHCMNVMKRCMDVIIILLFLFQCVAALCFVARALYLLLRVFFLFCLLSVTLVFYISISNRGLQPWTLTSILCCIDFWREYFYWLQMSIVRNISGWPM